MKRVEVKLTAEFTIPDDWEVVDHVPDPAFPDDVRRVIKVDGQFYDFFPECLVKMTDGDMVIWSADEGRAEDVIDCMESFTVEIREPEA